MLILLILFQIKHFVADYPLQNQYMLGKFKGGLDWVLPLSAHCLVHALMTLGIALLFNPKIAVYCALFDFVCHFCMDRIKASSNLMGRWKSLSPVSYKMCLNMSKGLSAVNGEALPSHIDENTLNSYKNLGKSDLKANTYFWWALGFDQMVHHLTHYAIIFALLMV